MAFNGRDVNLLRAAETCMAGFFYALHRMLILSPLLKAIVHSVQWGGFIESRAKKKRGTILRSEKDVKSVRFWKKTYILLRAIWPQLKLLRLSDSWKPGMDKLYYLVHKERVALVKSGDMLDDRHLFEDNEISEELQEDVSYKEGEDLEEEEEEGKAVAEEVEEEEKDSNNNEDEGEEIKLSEKLMSIFNKRAKKLEHDYAITGESFVCTNFLFQIH